MFMIEKCPTCGDRLELLSTTNEWRLYCRRCDRRFNDDLQPMKGADDGRK